MFDRYYESGKRKNGFHCSKLEKISTQLDLEGGKIKRKNREKS